MMKKSCFSNQVNFFIGLGVLLLSLGTLVSVDAPLIRHQTIIFQSQEGSRLVGTYYPGTIDAGVILFEGFGSDQVMMKNIASEFKGWGLHIFTFDFSGHGRSSGALGFDNAASDKLAYEILNATSEFQKLSGLDMHQIVGIGHSMGARMALRATMLQNSSFAGIILLGCQINLQTNVQASFFTGVEDTNLPWIQNLNSSNPSTNIVLVSGSFDDIIVPEAAHLLLDKLQEGGDVGYSRTLKIVPGVFHNYEIFSPRVIRLVKESVADNLQLLSIQGRPSLVPFKSIIRIIAWISFIVITFLSSKWLKPVLLSPKINLNGSTITISSNSIDSQTYITDPKRWVKAKMWLWLVSLPLFILLMGILVIIPLPQPVFNLIYVGFITAYGGTTALFYLLKPKTVGISGKLQGRSDKTNSSSIDIEWKPVIVLIGSVFLGLSLFMRSSWYYSFPLNIRLVWLFIYAVLSGFGFYIGAKERQLIMNSIDLTKERKSHLTKINNLIGFIPFFLLTVLYLLIQSYSGMLGSLQGLIILYWVYSVGDFIFKLTQQPILTASLQGLLLQWLVMPQNVLFKIF
ncbi:alpha/beta hydrolase [Candidatus Lokiarchaeum ossiferum]|uniref:alpha/beta hydrolase n=1 Tax=Candidatus Lokiarchaeum ossiferum TaxID=2951803 RepID=UPI00352F3784